METYLGYFFLTLPFILLSLWSGRMLGWSHTLIGLGILLSLTVNFSLAWWLVGRGVE